MKIRRWVGWGLGLTGCLFLAPVGMSTLRSFGTVNQVLPLRDQSEITLRTSVVFPDGARLVAGEWLNSFNAYGYARVELPPDKLSEFLAQPLFVGRTTRSDQPLAVNPIASIPHIRRWNLHAVRHSISASVGQLNDPNQSMPIDLFVDLDRPKCPNAYLHWYNCPPVNPGAP